MPTFDSHGVPIHYEVYGEGRPIVLVHGFSSSLKGNWVDTRWVEALTPIRQVVALDCRGHGESGKPHDPQAYADEAMSNDVIRTMDRLEIEKADLFGYSMGGAISLWLLMGHPDRFTSVVVGGVGDALVLRSRGRPNVTEALLTDDPSTITDPVARGFRIVAEANNNDLKALASCMQAPRPAMDPADLGRFSLPALIVIGEGDVLVGSPNELAAAIPGARLVTIPDRDHLTVVPDPRFKEAVVGFLNEVSPA